MVNAIGSTQGRGAMTKWEYYLVAANYIATLRDYGFTIEPVTRFEDVPDLAARTGRSFQMPAFSIPRADLTENSAFWLFLKLEGEYIGGAAAMLQNIGSERLDSYLNRTMNHHFPHASGKTIADMAGPLSEYSGKLAYIGELHFHKSYRGKREVLKSFMRLFHVLTLLEWNQDWIYAFIPERHMMVRLDLVYGFARTLEKAQIWSQPGPELRASCEWFVAASRSELDHMLRRDLQAEMSSE